MLKSSFKPLRLRGWYPPVKIRGGPDFGRLPPCRIPLLAHSGLCYGRLVTSLARPAPVPGTRWRARVVIAVAGLLAYLPALFGGYVYDDVRFVKDNEALEHLTPILYFTDPSTVAEESWEGIYRPLRTLDFAIDVAIAGRSPFFGHLRNLIYHLLGALLVYELIRRLVRSEAAALYGALAFVLHPVHTESVAWITSRADVMVLVAFLGALILHLDGRRRLAATALVIALLSKEAAVVFPAAVFLADRLRGERMRLGWYALYGGLSVGYTVFWFFFLGKGEMDGFGHLSQFWGGSYGANLLTMAKGFLYYANELLFPVGMAIDYHIPPSTSLDAGAFFGVTAVLVIGVAAWLAGPRARFAFAWFFVLLLPMSNLIRPIGIPTAERFLYLPSVGIALFAGPFLARSRLTLGILACFLVLTFARCFDWQSNEALFASAARVTLTPRGLSHRANRELEAAHAELEAANRALMEKRGEHLKRANEHAEETVRLVDELIVLYREQILLSPGKIGALVLSQKANALVILNEYEKALEAADAAIKLDGKCANAFYNAAVALSRLGEHRKAAANLERARELGHPAALER